MKLLIAGCSFSQSQRDNKDKLWRPWSDMINGDFVQEEVNVAQSSYGQGMIAQSIINACEVHNYKPDLAIVQWSAVQRAYSLNQKDFIEKIMSNVEPEFFNYNEEYSSNKLDLDTVSNVLTKLDRSAYMATLTHITLIQNYFESKGIKYFMYWGWGQISDRNHYKYQFDKLYESSKIGNWWIPNIHDSKHHLGMKEWATSKIGSDAKLQEDFHPSTQAHEIFYKDIIEPLLKPMI